MDFVPMNGDEAIALHDVGCDSKRTNREQHEFPKLFEDHSDHEPGRTEDHCSVYRE